MLLNLRLSADSIPSALTTYYQQLTRVVNIKLTLIESFVWHCAAGDLIPDKEDTPEAVSLGLGGKAMLEEHLQRVEAVSPENCLLAICCFGRLD